MRRVLNLLALMTALSVLVMLTRVDDAGGFSEAQEDSLTSLVCPSVHLCLGVDGYGGGLLSTTQPTGGTAAWQRVQLPDHEQFAAVTCPTATLCLAGGRGGYVFVSTDPTRGGATFRRVLVDTDPGAKFTPDIDDVACSSRNWCVAVDSNGGAVTTTDPVGPASAWTRSELDPGSADGFSAGLAAVTCRTSGLCVTVDPTGNVWASGAAFGQVATAPARLLLLPALVRDDQRQADRRLVGADRRSGDPGHRRRQPGCVRTGDRRSALKWA